MLLDFIKRNNIYSILTNVEKQKLVDLYFGEQSQTVFKMQLGMECKKSYKRTLKRLQNRRNEFLLELMEKYY